MDIIYGRQNIQTEAPAMLTDESKFTCGIPDIVFFPETENDIVEAVGQCNHAKMAIVPSGSRTGVAGGCVPVDCSAVISFSRMQKILRIEQTSNGSPVIYCQPGCTIRDINLFLKNPATWPYHVSGVEYLENKIWCFQPDPTETTCSVGGCVATNASGARSFRFGSTRSHIYSLKLIFSSGETATILKGKIKFAEDGCTFQTNQKTSFYLPVMQHRLPDIKHTCGYQTYPFMDLLDLFAGSEGTLCLFAEIGLNLKPEPSIISGLTFFPDHDLAFSVADFLRKQTPVMSIEYFDKTALDLLKSNTDSLSIKLPEFPTGTSCAIFWEFNDQPEGTFEQVIESWEKTLNEYGSSFEATWNGMTEKDREILRTFRHAVPELVNMTIGRYKQKTPGIRKIGTDAAVPVDRFRDHFEFCKEIICHHNLEYVVFGHLGDCHLHFNMLPKTQQELESSLTVYEKIMEKAVSVGGVISAEHGIGKIKRKYLSKMFSQQALAEMLQIKKILDPLNLLNPGTLV